ncbi:hypothetical protein DCAR_0101084 [Daucus carota subsp. sativus]|uniref:Poly A polymerase head domain-containing protein n=1 Tax=Daucus carota subsp. sativus TaxID=79200 RepID=A0AAF0W2I1_DAUCS|nr:PREDICTED: putative CCA tRNA nucleotidyltransferase 2 [Daucus carota subsp. sativus]WOG81927.1 hypothetical protein DCAR_0101084 [Daucus carota subsp. sativus]
MRVATAASRFLFTSSFPSNFNNRHFINPSSFIKPLRTTANLNKSPQSRRRLGFCDSSPPPVSAATFSPKMSPPPEVEVRESIELNDKEVQIFDRLRDVLRHFRLDTQLRVAGGWVRDKLLGKECYDIDIALDNMLGREFCEKVNEYLISTGEETHGVGVIQSNPDQSKHLETATMRLYDVWIDFVNLRAEDYCENSRIPTMRFGTAEEDAYRRDLTINSLFYNINSRAVEDLTGKGIEDLRAGKIVTPLPPRETFLDDPLRVLRAIRFGARFEFILDEGLKKAASADDVRAAIADKISRERIGHEIDLMVAGNQPVKAMSYVSTLQLFWVVFNPPPNVNPPIPEEHERLCVAYMDAAWKVLQSIGGSFSGDQKRLSLYAALLLPLRNTVYIDHKSKKIPAVSYIFRNSLKLKSSDAETVLRLHEAAEKFMTLFPLIISNEEKISEVSWKREIIDVPVASKLRILIGLLLREIKDFWRPALLLSTILYYDDIDSSSSFEQSKLDKSIVLFNQVESAVTTQGLDKIWEVKPLVNGKEIMSVLQLKTGGPLVREWVEKLLEWQLAHPSGSAEECIDWMRQAQSKRARTE